MQLYRRVFCCRRMMREPARTLKARNHLPAPSKTFSCSMCVCCPSHISCLELRVQSLGIICWALAMQGTQDGSPSAGHVFCDVCADKHRPLCTSVCVWRYSALRTLYTTVGAHAGECCHLIASPRKAAVHEVICEAPLARACGRCRLRPCSSPRFLYAALMGKSVVEIFY